MAASVAAEISGGRDKFAIGLSALKGVPWKTAGRKALFQLLDAAWGTPRGSGIATKLG